MIEKIIVITNNNISYDYFKNKYKVVFVEGSIMDVLIRVRDYIHKGHRLLTHPLMGSVKPNETPYKTVIISEYSNNTPDLQSIMYIENSIEVAQNLIKNKPQRNWPQSVLKDFAIIDFDLITNALNK
ncbi:GrdX protein [Caloramator sp. E03]|uniref:GrdX family protein n=1 Tax=Caloramator sp. E03 TaxID=2576307 RepID=UPI001110E6F8|nr:GrdX family protein [Caloramator sp. E03]QCX34642.1 GrdX protein [Caloramator sp. E03]